MPVLASSCKAPISALNTETVVQKSGITVLSAEMKHWHGGVRGVSGVTYYVKLKTDPKSKLVFKQLFANGVLMRAAAAKEKTGMLITASYSEHHDENVDDAPSEVAVKKISATNWLSYTDASGVLKKITLPTFKEIAEDENEEKIQ